MLQFIAKVSGDKDSLTAFKSTQPVFCNKILVVSAARTVLRGLLGQQAQFRCCALAKAAICAVMWRYYSAELSSQSSDLVRSQHCPPSFDSLAGALTPGEPAEVVGSLFFASPNSAPASTRYLSVSTLTCPHYMHVIFEIAVNASLPVSNNRNDHRLFHETTSRAYCCF